MMNQRCLQRPETMKMTRRGGHGTVPSYSRAARASGPSYFHWSDESGAGHNRACDSGVLDSRLVFRLKTPDSRLKTPDSRLKTPDSRLKTPDFRLQTQDSRLQTPDSRL
jgi:hypothetical protein